MLQQSTPPEPCPGDLSSRKRKARRDDNGEPMASTAAKKTKSVSHPRRKESAQQGGDTENFTTKARDQQSSSATQQRPHSVKVEDIPDEESTPQRYTPRSQQHIIEEVDDDNDLDDDYVEMHDFRDMAAEDFEKAEEDDEAILGVYQSQRQMIISY